MKKIQKLISFSILALTLASCGVQKAAMVQEKPSAGLCIGITEKGELLIRVTGIGRNVTSVMQEAEKEVVRELIFEGVEGKTEDRIKDIPPMVKDAGAKTVYAEYFSRFFSDNGIWTRFISPMQGSLPETTRTKKGYKVVFTCILKKNTLRKELEANGIIKSLSNI